MNITIIYSTNTLFEDERTRDEGVDDVASALNFEEMVKIQVVEDFPLAQEIDVYSGEEDKCICDGESTFFNYSDFESQIADIVKQIRQERNWVEYKKAPDA